MLSACPIHVVPTTVSVGDETEAISARLLQRVAMFHGVSMYDAGLNVGCTASGTVLGAHRQPVTSVVISASVARPARDYQLINSICLWFRCCIPSCLALAPGPIA